MDCFDHFSVPWHAARGILEATVDEITKPVVHVQINRGIELVPTEDRRIIFSSDEVYKALFALCAQKQVKKPPPGHVKGIEEDKEDNQKIYVHLENPQEQEKATVEYSRDFLAAALLLFCRGLGIPIPKIGKKSVLIKDGRVMLRVQVG